MLAWVLGIVAHAAEGEVEAAPPRAPVEIPTRLPRLAGPIGPDGVVQATFLTQFRIQLPVPLDGSAVALTAAIPRLRPGFALSLLRGGLAFRTQLELAPGRLELLDYVFESTVHPKATIRLGTTKIPFTRYRDASVGTLHFVDWSLATRMFGSERQFGLSVHDGWTAGPTYALGVFSGVNTRASHAVGLQEAYGRPLVNPSSLIAPSLGFVLHPEIVGRVGWSSGGATPLTSLDREGGAPRVTALVSFAVDAQPEPQVDLAARVAPELFLQARRFTFSALWYGGAFVDRDGAWQFGVSGAHGELTWAAHRWIEFGVRYAHVLRLPALEADVRAVTGADPVGPTFQQEVGFGWNSPMIGDAFEWATDIRYVDRVTGPQVEVRSQIQVML